MDDPTALFHQYEQDYCNKSTEISRKISALTGVTTGEAYSGLETRREHTAEKKEAVDLRDLSSHNVTPLSLLHTDVRRSKASEIEGDMREADSVVRGKCSVCAPRQQSSSLRALF